MKPILGLSIDMDNQWSYMKTHGDDGWEFYPSYFDVLVPYLLDLLDELELSITFFLVGIDVQQEKNHRFIQMIGERGHEPGNHSLHHEPWMHQFPKKRIREELVTTHNLLTDIFGISPCGFRGPGFSWSTDLLTELLDLGYHYDATTLPTFIGPLARLYFLYTSSLKKEERDQRKKMFGTITDGFRPVRPYTWKLPGNASLLELPVSTIPLLRTPFHLSYLLYLSRFSQKCMEYYLQMAILMCLATGTQPTFLLHPLDFLGGEQVPQLSFFPGMKIDSETKRNTFIRVMKILGQHFSIMKMSKYAETVSESAAGRIIPVLQS
jgi:hypothetical protein